MNWQCPRCETFNPAIIKYCEVCELAKPRKKAAPKTATKETGLIFGKPPAGTGGEAAAKPRETFTPVVKAADRRPSSATTKPAAAKTATSKIDAPKTPAPPAASTPADVQPKGGVIDGLSGVALLGFNIYFLYDFIAVRNLGIGSVLLGMVFGNLILLFVIGAVAGFLKWVLNPSDSTK